MGHFGGIFLPNQPPIDKIAAVAVVDMYVQPGIQVVGFWKTNQDPSEAQMAEWEERRILPIDIGSGKYHSVGSGSALERIVELLRIETDKTLDRLITIINNNNRTGYLKGGGHAISWILREAYKLGEDIGEVVDRSRHVVKLWLETSGVSCPCGAELDDRCGKLWDRVCENRSTFSLAEYLHNMKIAGVPASEIYERAIFFHAIEERARKEQRCAREMLSEPTNYRAFLLEQASCRGVSITTDNPYVAREVFRVMPNTCVVVCRSSKGNVDILTRGLDMESVAEALKRDEPDRWFYDIRIQGILNGTLSLSEVPATGKSVADIECLVRMLARRARR